MVASASASSSASAASRAISVVPANEASWDDVRAVFGIRGEPGRCQCQWFKIEASSWRSVPVDERARLLREQTGCDNPTAQHTSGLIAYLDGEPAGWVGVEPRSHLVRLRGNRIVWSEREEDPADDSVWAVSCFVTRVGYRRRGVSRALAHAAVDFARERGARAIEGYPMHVEPGRDLSWGELYVGSRAVFAEAGFSEVTHPTPRRFVMRIDFD